MVVPREHKNVSWFGFNKDSFVNIFIDDAKRLVTLIKSASCD